MHHFFVCSLPSQYILHFVLFCCRYDVDCTVTSVASHPSKMCFATGNRIGQIHLWYVKVGLVVCWGAKVYIRGAGISRYTFAHPHLHPSPLPYPRYDFGKSESVVVTTVYHWHAHAVADIHFTTDGNVLCAHWSRVWATSYFIFKEGGVTPFIGPL